MRAIHLPGLSGLNAQPPYSFPSTSPSASSLTYSASVAKPHSPNASGSQSHGLKQVPAYLLRVLTTALTRAELTWEEILEPGRFNAEHGSIPGHDVVGVVVEKFPAGHRPGAESDDNEKFGFKFKEGDKVFALLAFNRDGAAADYVVALESELALIPKSADGGGLRNSAGGNELARNIPASDEMLATIPLSCLTAWQALFVQGGLDEPHVGSLTTRDERHPREANQVRHSPHVHITGAAGSVGVFAVQLAKLGGCYVTAVCNERNASFIKAIGADEVVNSRTSRQPTSLPEGLEKILGKPADMVLDCVGGDMLRGLLTENGVAKEGGTVVTIAAPVAVAVGAGNEEAVAGTIRERRLDVKFFIVEPSGEQLGRIAQLVEGGKVTGFVDEVFELSMGREAMEKVERRGAVARGKVVLRVWDD